MKNEEFLTQEEMANLTGFVRAWKQAEHLRKHGVPFIPNAKGYPRVCRCVIRGDKADLKPKLEKPTWQPKAELR